MTDAETPTRVSIAAGPLVGPVLRRVVGMLAARADLPLDRLDDAVLVADLVAAHVAESTVEVALASSTRSLDLRVGPLRAGGGRALVVDSVVPGVGNVIEQLADGLEIETEGEREYLRVRLAYEPA